jgi:hypothetical protein
LSGTNLDALWSTEIPVGDAGSNLEAVKAAKVIEDLSIAQGDIKAIIRNNAIPSSNIVDHFDRTDTIVDSFPPF